MASVCLYHGTDLASAQHILTHGLDAAAAASYNGSGEFWATTDVATADWFAQTNYAGGTLARFEFELPEQVLQLVTSDPTLAVIHTLQDYEFFPPSFDLLNQSMSGKRVVPVP